MSVASRIGAALVLGAALRRSRGATPPTPTAGPPAPQGRAGPRSLVWVATLGLTVAAAIAMIETDRLLQGVTVDGRTGSLAQVESPLAVFQIREVLAVWDTWFHAPAGPPFVLILTHVLFDAAFLVGYAALLARLIGAAASRAAARTLLVGLVAAEVAEGLAVLGNAAVERAGAAAPTWLVEVGIGCTALKWLLVALLLAALLRSDRAVRSSLRTPAVDVLVRSLRALWVQRLSIIVVLVLALLGLLPLGDVFDQLPDVERSWADGTAPGIGHAALALVTAVLVAAALFVIGRQRAQLAWQREVRHRVPTTPAQVVWWLVGPALAVVTVVVLLVLGRGDLVDTYPHVLIFVGVPVGLVLLHLALERWHPALWTEGTPLGNRQAATDIRTAGDALAAAVVVVAGLGLVRSFVAPILLSVPGLARRPVDGGRLTEQVAFLALGIVLVAVTPAVAARCAARAERAAPGGWAARLLRQDDGSPVGSRLGPALAIGGPVAVLLVMLVLAPRHLTAVLGVVGTTLAVLGSWTVVTGFLVVGLQWHRPLAVFRLLHLAANPVLTLSVAILLATTAAGGAAPLHLVRTDPGAAAVTARPDLAAVFADWTRSALAAHCDRPVDGGRAMPLVLVAASGGGIRATAWTTRVLGTLAASPCGSAATLLSSGVSGGSVGLALSRGFGPPTGPEAVTRTPEAEVTRLAGPASLAVAAAALFDGDVTSTLTGIRLPAAAEGDGRWADRAGLIERGWENRGGAGAPSPLELPFSARVRGPAGALVLNSTAANLGCRVLVSQVDLRGTSLDRPDADVPVGADPPPPCQDDRGGLPSSSFDLLGSYGACVPPMTWATASMLSARFPFVTPAGRIDCPGRESLQLVDGGYAEGSGIATISDLAPDVMELVRDHNATAAATGEPIVVPYLLYLEDETRTDLDFNPPGLTPELFVPLVGRDAADQLGSSGSWTQRVADEIADPCPPGGPAGPCAAAVAALRSGVPHGIAVAAPLTEPAITAPLGWTLSADSLAQLVPSTDDRCADGRVQGYACLGRLLDVVAPPQ